MVFFTQLFVCLNSKAFIVEEFPHLHGYCQKGVMSKHITLIIDDEPDIRDMCERIISKSYDFDIIKVGSLKEARVALAGITPDIVLLDLNLPDGVGFDFVPHIKNVSPQSEILIITAYNQQKEIDRAHDVGAFSLLGKPFGSKQLKGRINEMLIKNNLEHVKK